MPLGNSLTNLQKEPKRLGDIADNLTKQLHDVCLTHYQVFLDNFTSLSTLLKQSEGTNKNIILLKEDLDSFNAVVGKYSEISNILLEELRGNKTTLEQCHAVVDILELPSLMATCIRNKLYSGAMDVVAEVCTLERRHFYPMYIDIYSQLLVEAESLPKSLKKEINSSLQSGENEDLPSDKSKNENAHISQMPRESLNSNSTLHISIHDWQNAVHNYIQEHPEITILYGIIASVKKQEVQLHNLLVHSLSQQITLPMCLQIVGCLRKLNMYKDVHRNYLSSKKSDHQVSSNHQSKENNKSNTTIETEYKLQLEFLQARSIWLNNQVSPYISTLSSYLYGSKYEKNERDSIRSSKTVVLSGGSSKSGTNSSFETAPEIILHQQLISYLDICRTGWYEIVTQYRAIFTDDVSDVSIKKDSEGVSHVLSHWLLLQTQELLKILKNVVPLCIDRVKAGPTKQISGRLSSTTHEGGPVLQEIMENCNYFGSSLSRIGFDIRDLFVPIFINNVIYLTESYMQEALIGVEDCLGNIQSVLQNQIKNRINSADDSGIFSSVKSSGIDDIISNFPVSLCTNNNALASTMKKTKPFHLNDDSPEGTNKSENIKDEKESAVNHQSISKFIFLARSPSRLLLSYPTLAHFVNAILGCFNQVRHVLITDMKAEIEDGLLQALSQVFQLLGQYKKNLLVLNDSIITNSANFRSIDRKEGRISLHLVQPLEDLESTCYIYIVYVVPYLLATAYLLLNGEEGEERYQQGNDSSKEMEKYLGKMKTKPTDQSNVIKNQNMLLELMRTNNLSLPKDLSLDYADDLTF